MLQFRALDEEGVFHALAQRADLGELHVEVVAREHARDQVEQAGTVAGGDVQDPALGLFVRPQGDARGDGKTLDPARDALAAGFGQRSAFLDGAREFALDHVGEFAVVAGLLRRDDLEGVERMAVAGGVHARVQDAESRAVEVAADAREEIRLVGGVHGHLHAFARQGLAGADDRAVRAHVAGHVAGVPGDVRGLVPHEVADIQRVPELFVALEGLGVEREQDQRFALAGLDLGGGVRSAPAQRAQRGAVEVLQQLAFPGVPDLGAGAADVRDGEQVQRGEAPLAAHAPGECGDDVGVGEVLLLRHLAHGEVLGHQEFDQRGVFRAHAVLAAEVAHFLGADA